MTTRKTTTKPAVKPKTKPKPEKLVKVTVAKGLSMKEGREKVWKAAKRKGKNDARSLGYDPKTGKGWAL